MYLQDVETKIKEGGAHAAFVTSSFYDDFLSSSNVTIEEIRQEAQKSLASKQQSMSSSSGSIRGHGAFSMKKKKVCLLSMAHCSILVHVKSTSSHHNLTFLSCLRFYLRSFLPPVCRFRVTTVEGH